MQNLTIPYDKKVKVIVPKNAQSMFDMNNVSISADSPIPNSGRVVLFLQSIFDEGKFGNEIAICPLTIGKNESVKVDYQFMPGNQFILSTKGDKINVTVVGFMESLETVITEIIA